MEEHGGRVAATPREAAEGAAAVITMVVDGPQVEEVLLGADGAVGGAAPGTLFVDCRTIAPADARRIGAALSERGHGVRGRAGHRLLAQGRGRHADDHGRRRADADFERARPLLRRDGRDDPARRPGRPRADRSRSSRTPWRDELRHARPGARRRPRDGRRRRGARCRSWLNGSANSTMVRLEGEADAGARLRAAVQARAHAQGRRLASRRGSPPARRSPSAALPHELYARRDAAAGLGERGLRRGARGGRGPRRRARLTRVSDGCGHADMTLPICSDILGSRDVCA